MGDRLRYHAVTIAHNVVALVLLALLPGIIVGLAAIWVAVGWPVMLTTAGWIASMLLGVFWYWHIHVPGRAELELKLVNGAFISEQALARLIPEEAWATRGQEVAHSAITHLLYRMCETLVYRFPTSDKGATFLLIDSASRELDPHFQLFAAYNHPEEDRLSNQVSGFYTLENSFAGQAIKTAKCLTMRDSRNPPRGFKWCNVNDEASDYRGRAATEVTSWASGKRHTVGVLCFDTKRPHTLGRHEQRIMQAYATQIAQIWNICYSVE